MNLCLLVDYGLDNTGGKNPTFFGFYLVFGFFPEPTICLPANLKRNRLKEAF